MACPTTQCLSNERDGQKGPRTQVRRGSWACHLRLGSGVCVFRGFQGTRLLLCWPETWGSGHPASSAHLSPETSGLLCRWRGASPRTVIPIPAITEVVLVAATCGTLCAEAHLPGISACISWQQDFGVRVSFLPRSQMALQTLDQALRGGWWASPGCGEHTAYQATPPRAVLPGTLPPRGPRALRADRAEGARPPLPPGYFQQVRPTHRDLKAPELFLAPQ